MVMSQGALTADPGPGGHLGAWQRGWLLPHSSGPLRPPVSELSPFGVCSAQPGAQAGMGGGLPPSTSCLAADVWTKGNLCTWGPSTLWQGDVSAPLCLRPTLLTLSTRVHLCLYPAAVVPLFLEADNLLKHHGSLSAPDSWSGPLA